MQARFLHKLAAVVLGCSALLLPAARANAQAARSNPDATPVSRVELYGAYSYLKPYQADINNFYYEPINPGAIGGLNYYFTRHFGAEVEGGYHPHGPNDCVFTAQGGPVFRYQMRRFVPFAHVLGGGAKVGGPVFQPCTWGWGGTGGLGVDFVMKKWLAVRPVQADYNYNYVNFGPLVVPAGVSGGLAKMNAYRLSAGVVIRFGNIENEVAAGMSCSAEPGDVFAGEPVTIHSEVINLNPKHKTAYTWQASGGKLSGTGPTVAVATDGLAPGVYTVNGHVSQGGRSEQNADCTARFAIKEVPVPPTIACSATPSSIRPGETSTVTSVANSTQNRKLTYSYSVSGGTIEGNGTTANYVSGGVLPGTVTVTCNVVDDQGKSAVATTTIQILSPPVPPAPQTMALCSTSFDRDRRRPARVDNEAKGCLDDIALTMQRQTDSKLIIVGMHQPGESPDIGAQRTVNTKLYLTREKGIDPSRIILRNGAAFGRRVEHTLVPAGATYLPTNSALIDESTVKTVGPAYGVPRPQGAPAPRRARRRRR